MHPLLQTLLPMLADMPLLEDARAPDPHNFGYADCWGKGLGVSFHHLQPRLSALVLCSGLAPVVWVAPEYRFDAKSAHDHFLNAQRAQARDAFFHRLQEAVTPLLRTEDILAVRVHHANKLVTLFTRDDGKEVHQQSPIASLLRNKAAA